MGISSRKNTGRRHRLTPTGILCAFYKKIMRDLGGQRIDFCGHRAYNSIMAKGKKTNRWQGGKNRMAAKRKMNAPAIFLDMDGSIADLYGVEGW